MTDPIQQREAVSLQQLAAVAQARHIRLRSERAVLSERERALAQALANQETDEAVLAEQRSRWSGRWQAWIHAGGELREGTSLRNDRDLLRDMAALVQSRREALQAQCDRLVRDLAAWTQRWCGAEALDDSLAARGQVLRVSLERATERQRDEDALMSRPVLASAPMARALQR
jgi:hypothetical protein